MFVNSTTETIFTAKLLNQDYPYHKIRKAFTETQS